MSRFTDTAGRDWIVAVNVFSIKRVRVALEIDLTQVYDADGTDILTRLANDPVALVDVLYVLCRDQAVERDLSDEDFARAVAGDVIDQATGAFVEAMIHFFPHRQSRPLAAIWARVTRGDERVAEALLDRVEGGSLDRLVDDQVTKAIMEMDNALTSGRSSHESPVSSD